MREKPALRRVALAAGVLALGALGGISATALGSRGSGSGNEPTTGPTTTTTTTEDRSCPKYPKMYVCRLPSPTTTNPR
jgi:hypothetical protein